MGSLFPNPNDLPGLYDELPPDGTTTFSREFPNDFKLSSTLTAVVMVNGQSPNGCSNQTETIFGATTFNTIFDGVDGSDTYGRCFTYARVDLTAGVTRSPSSTYISNTVVEANLEDEFTEIEPGPWVQEAMYLMADVMSAVSMANSTGLGTWDNLDGYLSKLVRYSYQAAWDMLFRTFDDRLSDLKVRIYERRQEAKVSKARVFAWLSISSLLPLSANYTGLGTRYVF